MKKVTLILFAGLVLFFSSCNLETYGRPTCSIRDNTGKQRQKAQTRYAKRSVRKYGVISSLL